MLRDRFPVDPLPDTALSEDDELRPPSLWRRRTRGPRGPQTKTQKQPKQHSNGKGRLV